MTSKSIWACSFLTTNSVSLSRNRDTQISFYISSGKLHFSNNLCAYLNCWISWIKLFIISITILLMPEVAHAHTHTLTHTHIHTSQFRDLALLIFLIVCMLSISVISNFCYFLSFLDFRITCISFSSLTGNLDHCFSALFFPNLIT